MQYYFANNKWRVNQVYLNTNSLIKRNLEFIVCNVKLYIIHRSLAKIIYTFMNAMHMLFYGRCTTMSFLGCRQEYTRIFFSFLEFTFEATPCSFTIQISKAESPHAANITLIFCRILICEWHHLGRTIILPFLLARIVPKAPWFCQEATYIYYRQNWLTKWIGVCGTWTTWNLELQWSSRILHLEF